MIMKKIKTWLIHLLGGVTASESQERGIDRSFVGAYVALTIIKKYSESLYGKFNPDTLQVEPVKPVCLFKPFDKVLVRCGNGIWGATFFSRCDKESTWTYVGVDCNNWEQCIPYNEHTAHLLGTADPYTEGGSV